MSDDSEGPGGTSAGAPPLGGPGVDDTQIAGITVDVWSAFTDLAVAPATPDQAPAVAGPDVAVATVRVEGAWQGCIELACPEPLARRAAAAMLAAPADTLGAADVADALGELTNMVGGNVKSLLPAPSRLSVPTVALAGSAPRVGPGDELTHRVGLVCDEVAMTVSVWRTGHGDAAPAGAAAEAEGNRTPLRE